MKYSLISLILGIGFLCSAAVYAVEPGMIHMCVRQTGVVVVNNASDTCPANQQSMYVQRAIPGQRVAMGVLAHVHADDVVDPPSSGLNPVQLPGMITSFNTSTTGCIKVTLMLELTHTGGGGPGYFQVRLDGSPIQSGQFIPGITEGLESSLVIWGVGSEIEGPLLHGSVWTCGVTIGNHVVDIVWPGRDVVSGLLSVKSRSLLVEGW
jgi:hypothetical protein